MLKGNWKLNTETVIHGDALLRKGTAPEETA